ncbi:MAG: thymidylate kinase [Ruminococcaceae bacterium]|nr:thymidylate kinase [Oscillospiraceae bacterium]
MQSRLIVIEGVDASGKETQARCLYERLRAQREDVFSVRFPNYESESSALVKMYLRGDFGERAEDVNAYTASVFFAADRAASVLGQWRKEFFGGGVVIADRYTPSNLIHQASKIKGQNERDAFLDWSCELEYEKMGLPKPDLVIFLDMPPEYARQLMAGRENKIDHSQSKDIHERDASHLQSAYDSAVYVAKRSGWKTVHCVKDGKIRTVEEIADEVYASVSALL